MKIDRNRLVERDQKIERHSAALRVDKRSNPVEDGRFIPRMKELAVVVDIGLLLGEVLEGQLPGIGFDDEIEGVGIVLFNHDMAFDQELIGGFFQIDDGHRVVKNVMHPADAVVWGNAKGTRSNLDVVSLKRAHEQAMRAELNRLRV